MKTERPSVIPPSFIVIGAQKCGTSALFKYLSCHPQLRPPSTKEIDFFNCNSRYRQGTEFYHSYFPPASRENEGKQSFDVTPGYFGSAALAASRIHRYDSKIKLVLLLRDPNARAFSAWQMYRKFYAANPNWFFDWVKMCDENLPREFFIARPATFGKSFERDLEDEIKAVEDGRTIEMPILLLGQYYDLLSFFLKYFSREQLLLIATERMEADTIGALKKIETFAGLEPGDWNQNKTAPHFTGDYDEALPDLAQSLLNDFYRDQIKQLSSVPGLDLPWMAGKSAAT